jgi:PBSX family phage terminase large subunit
MDVNRYIEAAKAGGMPADQLRNFLRVKIVLQPRQIAASAAARSCDRPCTHHPDDKCNDGCAPTKIGYGGARGGGKSHWGIAQVVADDMTRFPGLKFLYLRKVGKTGKEAVHDLRRSVLHSTPHEWRAQDNMIVLDNGSRCILGHFQNEKDIDNYLGLEYDGALIEESTQLSERKVNDIATCVRTSKIGWRPRMYFTTNPGNIGHAWFKALFIAPLRAAKERLTRFIQATVYDNKFVNPEYRRELEGLTGWQRRAWLEGDWDIAAGQYFSTWREAHHVADFIAQPHWSYWLAIDYGFVHLTYVSLQALDGDGMLYIVDEYAKNRTLPEIHAYHMDEMLARHNLERAFLTTIVGGHDFFSPDQFGGSKADAYAEAGYALARARIDRKAGASAILRRLGDPGNDEQPRPPTMIVHRRCKRLIECIPSLIHKDSDPEDVLKVDCDEEGKGGDDAYDSVRYGVMEAEKGQIGCSGGRPVRHVSRGQAHGIPGRIIR